MANITDERTKADLKALLAKMKSQLRLLFLARKSDYPPCSGQ